MNDEPNPEPQWRRLPNGDWVPIRPLDARDRRASSSGVTTGMIVLAVVLGIAGLVMVSVFVLVITSFKSIGSNK